MYEGNNKIQPSEQRSMKDLIQHQVIANEIELSKKENNEGDNLLSKIDSNKSLVTLEQLLQSNSGEIGGMEDGKLTKAFFRKFLTVEQCCALFSVIALGLSVIEYDLEFNEKFEEVSTIHNKKIAMILLWTILASTCVSILLTILRYQCQLKYQQVRKHASIKHNIFTSGAWVNMVYEILILCIIPYPFTWNIRVYFFNQVQLSDAYYHVNEILALLMTLRVILLVRTVFIQSIWYSNRTQRVCNLYACEANYMFVIKSLMRYKPYTVIFTAMIVMIFVFGYAVRICESPLARNDPTIDNLSLYSNALWNMIITMTTVGYGDFYARTDLGRLVIFFVCIFGVFVVSMMVVTLTESLFTTSLEGKAITVLERLQVREDMIHLAATVITLMAKIGFKWKKGLLTKKEHSRGLIKLRKAMNEFKVTQRLYRSIQDKNSINEELTREFDLLKSHFKDLMDTQDKLVTLNEAILNNIRDQN